MTWWEIVHPFEALPCPLEIEADTIQRTWTGELRLSRDGVVVASFKSRAWAAYFQRDHRRRPPEPVDETQRPYTGLPTPIERPTGWNR